MTLETMNAYINETLAEREKWIDDATRDYTEADLKRDKLRFEELLEAIDTEAGVNKMMSRYYRQTLKPIVN
jgi:hypothetical protein